MANRRARHWAHDTNLANSGAIGSLVTRDLLAPWRAAFGTQFQRITLIRTLLTITVGLVSTVTNGAWAMGVIRGSINAPPVVNPITVGVDDFTDWILWDAGPQLSVLSNSDAYQDVRHFDARSMRRFDGSRETIWLMFSTSGGESGSVSFFSGARLLLLDQ